jgi:hypothetical protein
MNRIKKVFSMIHLGGWVLLFVFFCWVFRSEGHANWLYLSPMLLLGSMAIFYSHFILLTRCLNRKKYGYYLLGLPLILLLGPLPLVWIEGRGMRSWPVFLDSYFTTLLSVVLFFVVLSYLARAIENWFLNTLRREQLEKQSVQAELSSLKLQINPHFLFNTLNNIHTLAYKKADSTPEAIMRLASLMRYMLYEANADTVALGREIAYLQDFINLQQLRYKKSPVVDIEVAGDVDSCRVAPLLFVHLLENAYKHSHMHLNPGDIKVCIEVKGEEVSFRIRNPVGDQHGKDVEEVGGIGLANVRKRLELLYPGRHHFEVSRTEALFHVVLKIQCLQAPGHER